MGLEALEFLRQPVATRTRPVPAWTGRQQWKPLRTPRRPGRLSDGGPRPRKRQEAAR